MRVISRRCDKGEETARVLEIRGGPAGRPILWQASPHELPLDGGTRIEVRLRQSPHAENGLLWGGKIGKNRSLARVVAALAPSLDVSLVSGEDDALAAVVTGGDWLNIPDIKLLRRLNFENVNDKPAASTVSLMRHLKGPNGEVFGRATISPSSYWSDGSGWVTVSGLRANRLSNVQGILSGDAITAARDAALPRVPKDVLSAWATDQARLLLESRLDDERKAKSAETVLECGGTIGQLPILRWAGEWLNPEEFATRITDLSELAFNFEGEFSYDEDEDAMHPRDFKDDFKEADTVIMVPKHNGTIINARGLSWPASLHEGRGNTTRLSELVRQVIRDTWKDDFDEFEEHRVVGEAAGYDVRRTVTIYARPDRERDGAGE